jgi:hypothetical protein
MLERPPPARPPAATAIASSSGASGRGSAIAGRMAATARASSFIQPPGDLQPSRFRTIQVCPNDRVILPPAGS